MNAHEMFDLTGKTAIVTGGTGLYGTPISEGLAEAGAVAIIASAMEKGAKDMPNNYKSAV
jgi:NAD(P)-dependent dehydrogenase (short-subunit alcohol dehydrogenase family)